MKYKNAQNILPINLLKEIQKYIQGDNIYIPITTEGKVAWGEKNGTKKDMYYRNKEIFDLYKEGYSIEYISSLYNLSDSSIRKIITKMKKEHTTPKEALSLGGTANE